MELEGLVSVKTLLRWLIAIPLILAGCWFYFVSGLIGGGKLHLYRSVCRSGFTELHLAAIFGGFY